MTVVNAGDEDAAQREMVDADAFFGKLTPELLSVATRLRWVQSPTASLEHYVFPELVEHPLQLTNMRGLFSDNIADQVLGYVICFARNLHVYIRNQATATWAPTGGEEARVAFAAGPATVGPIDRAHMHLADATIGVVGLGAIGAEIARRARAFGMRVLAVDPLRSDKPDDVESLWPVERLPDLLAESDFVAIAAPHTPETFKMFRREQFGQMKSTAYLINIGRGVIVDLADLTAALQSQEIAGAALGRIRDRAAPRRSSVVEDVQRHHHTPRGRLLAPRSRTPFGRHPRKRRPLRTRQTANQRRRQRTLVLNNACHGHCPCLLLPSLAARHLNSGFCELNAVCECLCRRSLRLQQVHACCTKLPDRLL